MAGRRNLPVGIRHIVDFIAPSHICKLPGCGAPCYIEPNGHEHDFCGRGHANQYRLLKEAEKAEEERQKQLKKQQRKTQNVGANGTRVDRPYFNYVGVCGGHSHAYSGKYA